jgi:hypothetical protein
MRKFISRNYTHNESHLRRTIAFCKLRFGSSVQVVFEPLRFGSEEELTFSRAVARFQHLMILEE